MLRKVVASLLLVVVCGGAVACGPPDTSAPQGDAPEKTTITVGIIPLDVSAGLVAAYKRGFFAAEGLQVKLKTVQSTAPGLPDLIGGSTDVLIGNWVTVLDRKVQAQAESVGGLKAIFDAYQGGENTCVIAAPADSGISQIKDLVGKKIAIPAPNTIADLSVNSIMRGVASSKQAQVRFVAVGFPVMADAMAAGRVDAAWLCEPFLTRAQVRGIGPDKREIRKVADTFTGAMKAFEVASWVATGDWVSKHPTTVAAFQRAMAKGQRLVASDRRVVQEMLTAPDYAGIDPVTAQTMAIGSFPTGLNVDRVQRVAAFMQDMRPFGFDPVTTDRERIEQMLVRAP